MRNGLPGGRRRSGAARGRRPVPCGRWREQRRGTGFGWFGPDSGGKAPVALQRRGPHVSEVAF